MKKFIGKFRDGRHDNASPQPPATYPQNQHPQNQQLRPQYGGQQAPSNNGNQAGLTQSFGNLSVSPYQQQQQQQQPPPPQQPYQQQPYQQQPYQQQYHQQPYSQFQQQQPQQRPQSLSPIYATPSSSPSPGLQPLQYQQQQQQLGSGPSETRRSSHGNNDIARFLVEQGDNLVANNDFAGAITTYTLAIQANPMDPDLLIKRAYAYRMVEPAKVEEALRDAQTACRSNPYDWRIWSQLGQIYLQNKDAHFAREALEKAIELGGNQVSSVTRSALDMARNMIEQGTAASTIPASTQVSQPMVQPTQPVQPVQPIPPTQAVQPTQPIQPVQFTPPPQAVSSVVPGTTPATTSFSTSTIPPSIVTPPLPQKSPLNAPNLSPQSAQTTPIPPRSPNPDTQNVRTNAPSHVIPTTDFTNPAFAPPIYAPNTTSTDPAVRGLSQQALTAQLNEFQAQLSTRLRGAMSAKAYTTVDKLDTVKLVYVGLEQSELTNKELGTPVFAHPAFQRIYASTVDYPGSSYLDFDPETLVIYDGGAPGTLSVSGYAEEYRQQQFQRTPRITIALEQQTPLPEVTIDFLVKRVHTLQYPSTHSRTDTALKQVLGNAPSLTGTDDLQTQIQAICFTLNRKDSTKFATYTQGGRNVTNHLFGSKDQGIGVKNWLHQLVLGSELLLRLRAETRVISYSGYITDEISALLFVCDEFMRDVDIRIKPEKTGLDDPSRYTFVAREHTRQSAALIRFAEVLKWPYMDDVRNYCENAFDDIIAGRYVIFDIYDWLYSLFRPGFHFRFQLMSCLRYATPRIRDLGGAPYYESGIVVGNKSYWSRRTVLGKVLGGCKTTTMVCGWIGPCVKPIGVDIKPVKKDGVDVQVEGTWVELTARAVSCPVPCSGAQDTNYQYQRADEDESTFVSHLVNAENWMSATGPTLGTTERPSVKLETLSLANVKGTPKPGATDLEKRPSYRPTVTFTVGSSEISYTLYSNPFFVFANPCIGEHPLFDRQIAKLTKNTYRVTQLKDAYPEPNAVIVIDALAVDEDGDEECLARAWCSERGLNAIVRRGRGCCYGCAVTLATQRLGLGFNVLICS